MKEHKMLRVFARFAGQEVNVTETDHVYTPRTGGEPIPYKSQSLDSHNPLVDELKKAAADNGFSSVRVWLPIMADTMDYHPDRLNVDVDKSADGKWRLNNFRPG